MKDTIYRDEAVEICERWRQRAKEHHDRNGWYMADILLRFMKEMPSANRLQGEWIGYEVPSKCSVCGHDWDEYVMGQEIFYNGDIPNYCPNCGAQMREVDNE